MFDGVGGMPLNIVDHRPWSVRGLSGEETMRAALVKGMMMPNKMTLTSALLIILKDHHPGFVVSVGLIRPGVSIAEAERKGPSACSFTRWHAADHAAQRRRWSTLGFSTIDFTGLSIQGD